MYEITQNTIVDQILGARLRGASLYRHYNVWGCARIHMAHKYA